MNFQKIQIHRGEHVNLKNYDFIFTITLARIKILTSSFLQTYLFLAKNINVYNARQNLFDHLTLCVTYNLLHKSAEKFYNFEFPSSDFYNKIQSENFLFNKHLNRLSDAIPILEREFQHTLSLYGNTVYQIA